MKIKIKLCLIVLALAFQILFSILTLSMASASPTITETPITTSEYAGKPDIYGDVIVWSDDRNGTDEPKLKDS